MTKIKIKATDTQVSVSEKSGKPTSGGINQIKCSFELSEEYNNLIVRAIFNDKAVTVINGECYAPVLAEGRCIIGVYAYAVENGKTVLRLSPEPCVMYIYQGSYSEEIAESETPSPSELEKYYSQIKDLICDTSYKINDEGYLIITQADGTEINAGYAIGADGKSAYEIAVENGYTGTEAEWIESLKGNPGTDGNDYILTDKDKQEIAGLIENSEFQKLDLTEDINLSTLESGAYQVTVEGFVTTPRKDRHWVSKDGLIFIESRPYGYFDCFIADSSPKLISYIDSELKVIELKYLYDYIPITDFIFGFIEETLPNEYAKKSEIPTKTSQLKNDSGFLTEHQDISHLQERLSDEQLSNIADIPNKVSTDYVNTAIQTAITDVSTLIGTVEEVAE